MLVANEKDFVKKMSKGTLVSFAGDLEVVIDVSSEKLYEIELQTFDLQSGIFQEYLLKKDKIKVYDIKILS